MNPLYIYHLLVYHIGYTCMLLLLLYIYNVVFVAKEILNKPLVHLTSRLYKKSKLGLDLVVLYNKIMLSYLIYINVY